MEIKFSWLVPYNYKIYLKILNKTLKKDIIKNNVNVKYYCVSIKHKEEMKKKKKTIVQLPHKGGCDVFF